MFELLKNFKFKLCALQSILFNSNVNKLNPLKPKSSTLTFIPK